MFFMVTIQNVSRTKSMIFRIRDVTKRGHAEIWAEHKAAELSVKGEMWWVSAIANPHDATDCITKPHPNFVQPITVLYSKLIDNPEEA